MSGLFLKKNRSTDCLVLSLLENEEMYGSQMIHALEERGETAFDKNQGAIYPVLHRLVKKKLLDACWRDCEGLERRCYRISEKGKEILKKEKSKQQLKQG
ncbi:MAG: helix-turn-helix transcriptional regulator [Lachnospiraceae bacterium]|nr:helix-turn-helix transcriptional regulator [Lachnospiraceae bacterium]MBQ9563574.1 helix-turn-helix transcriptional regulator [Lachnospiraceae bacterium]